MQWETGASSDRGFFEYTTKIAATYKFVAGSELFYPQTGSRILGIPGMPMNGDRVPAYNQVLNLYRIDSFTLGFPKQTCCAGTPGTFSAMAAAWSQHHGALRINQRQRHYRWRSETEATGRI